MATDVAPATPVTVKRGGGIGQSLTDSLVTAKRNLIRMLRIPNLVRSHRLGSISPRIRDRRPTLKEQAK